MSEFKRAELSKYQQAVLAELCRGSELIVAAGEHSYLLRLPPDAQGEFAPIPIHAASVEQLINKGWLRQASDAAPAASLVLTAWSEQCF